MVNQEFLEIKNDGVESGHYASSKLRSLLLRKFNWIHPRSVYVEDGAGNAAAIVIPVSKMQV